MTFAFLFLHVFACCGPALLEHRNKQTDRQADRQTWLPSRAPLPDAPRDAARHRLALTNARTINKCPCGGRSAVIKSETITFVHGVTLLVAAQLGLSWAQHGCSKAHYKCSTNTASALYGHSTAQPRRSIDAANGAWSQYGAAWAQHRCSKGYQGIKL